MLWSALRIILFIGVIAALTLGAGYLMESPGGIRIELASTEFNLSAIQAAIALLLLVVLVWVLLKLLGFVNALLRFANGDETAISRFFDRRSQQRGFEALSEGMMALAAGDGRLALAKATKAERYLQRPDLTNLIAAQAAELAGDGRKTTDAYKRLLHDERTRFVGVRGLLKQKLQEGDTDTALKLAEKAFALKPSHSETGDILLRLQARNEDWEGARKTLAAETRNGVLPRDVHRRRDAVLALQQARDVFRHGSTIEARETAIEANRLSPDLVPAAVMAAQAYITDDKPRYAERVLRKAWSAQPHPDLAAAFAAVAPDEDPKERLRRFNSLLKISPDHEETRMLKAELQISAGDFVAARAALGDLAETRPTARTLTLKAAIERGEGADDATVRAYLTRAVTAPRGPQWICDNCNKAHAIWEPVCDNCDGFDTIAWKTSADAEAPIPGSQDTLPILVTPSPKEPEPEPEPVADEPEGSAEESTAAPERKPKPENIKVVEPAEEVPLDAVDDRGKKANYTEHPGDMAEVRN